MRKSIKKIRIADKRVVRAATAYINQFREDTPMLWMGKKLFDLHSRLGNALEARDKLKK